MDETAALQLFAHLDGEALNVTLLMPEGERANWEGLSQGLSDYYNSPGRLAEFRRQFESATRRTKINPVTFATDLDILAVRGFGDMGKCARNWMVRDRFIAAQRSCGLRRHLDSVPPDIPMRDIVDRCRVWESHSDQIPEVSGGGFTDSVANVIQSDIVAHRRGGGADAVRLPPPPWKSCPP